MAILINSDPIIDQILALYQTDLGSHYQKYRNHVYRVLNLTLMLNSEEQSSEKALAIAAAFHDLGIWTAHTFDYLSPSIDLAKAYLKKHALTNLKSMVTDIINNHHKFSNYKGIEIAESFRKADLTDLTFGFINFGVTRYDLNELNKEFPSLGFHRFIVKQALKNTLKHPLNPLPMMKW